MDGYLHSNIDKSGEGLMDWVSVDETSDLCPVLRVVVEIGEAIEEGQALIDPNFTRENAEV